MKKLVVLSVAILVILGMRAIYLNSYLCWPTEKKQSYQFMLLERKLLYHPEKCKKIIVVIRETNLESKFDTLSPLEIKKLVSYPHVFEVTVTVPFKEFGENYCLSLTKCGGKISAWIVRPLPLLGKTAVTFEKIDDGQEGLTLECLKQANKIVRNI